MVVFNHGHTDIFAYVCVKTWTCWNTHECWHRYTCVHEICVCASVQMHMNKYSLRYSHKSIWVDTCNVNAHIYITYTHVPRCICWHKHNRCIHMHTYMKILMFCTHVYAFVHMYMKTTFSRFLFVWTIKLHFSKSNLHFSFHFTRTIIIFYW